MNAACSILGCDRIGQIKRGWCGTHYRRWERMGDPLMVRLHPTKHGLARRLGGPHPLYWTWQTMMSRCYNPKFSQYARYGARGISVCERWHDISAFIADMAPRPPGCSLDRIDNDSLYSPENCRWASSTVQSRNRRSNKMTEEKVRELRRQYANGMRLFQVAEQFGIRPSSAHAIVNNVIWRE